MVYLSTTVCVIFHFQFHLVSIKLYIFVQQKAWTHELIKIKTIEKTYTVLLPEL